MPWNTLTVANATAGNAILATDHAKAFENLNGAPRGLIVAKENTNLNQSISTTAADITSLSVTFTAEASRFYKLSLFIPYGQRPVGGRLALYLTNSAATTTYVTGYFDGADSMPKEWTLTRILTFSAGSQTVKARAQIDAGSGSGTIICSSTAPGVIWVEDMGTFGTLS